MQDSCKLNFIYKTKNGLNDLNFFGFVWWYKRENAWQNWENKTSAISFDILWNLCCSWYFFVSITKIFSLRKVFWHVLCLNVFKVTLLIKKKEQNKEFSSSS